VRRAGQPHRQPQPEGKEIKEVMSTMRAFAPYALIAQRIA